MFVRITSTPNSPRKSVKILGNQLRLLKMFALEIKLNKKYYAILELQQMKIWK